jgi:type IV pilus biogenesis protein CpaD/CtpE
MPVQHSALRPIPAIFVICVALAQTGCTDPASLPVPTAAQPCPPYVLFPAALYSEADSPYIGCTVAVNLRTQAERPADLDHGRPLGPADGQRETLAVETYQQGKIKAFPAGSSTTIAPGGGQ